MFYWRRIATLTAQHLNHPFSFRFLAVRRCFAFSVFVVAVDFFPVRVSVLRCFTCLLFFFTFSFASCVVCRIHARVGVVCCLLPRWRCGGPHPRQSPGPHLCLPWGQPTRRCGRYPARGLRIAGG